MREVILDGSKWQRPDDLYDSFFQAVGAPKWHGRNFNALRDSISTGQINQIEVPYRIVIIDFARIGPVAQQIAVDFISLIKRLSTEGCPVEIEKVGAV
ncbi:MAG TPA: barstar family protein [Acidobacteriaceae bacterium]|nr:barstar family protein [Acidobacteriaceae bacterium]